MLARFDALAFRSYQSKQQRQLIKRRFSKGSLATHAVGALRAASPTRGLLRSDSMDAVSISSEESPSATTSPAPSAAPAAAEGIELEEAHRV